MVLFLVTKVWRAWCVILWEEGEDDVGFEEVWERLVHEARILQRKDAMEELRGDLPPKCISCCPHRPNSTWDTFSKVWLDLMGSTNLGSLSFPYSYIGFFALSIALTSKWLSLLRSSPVLVPRTEVPNHIRARPGRTVLGLSYLYFRDCGESIIALLRIVVWCLLYATFIARIKLQFAIRHQLAITFWLTATF